MNIITIPSLKTDEKALITRNFLIPKIMKDNNIDAFNVNISDELIKHIIESYTYEGGVRKLKDRLNEIILEINLRKLMKKKVNNKHINSSVTLTKDIIDKDLLKDRHTFDHEKRYKKNKVGLANGMWANSMGVGGLTPIQCSWIPSEKKLGLELTGLQGQTMKESMSVARTVAWKLLPDELKLKFSSELNESSDLNKGNSNMYGIHIHVPDGGTSKDGPSAGTTITTAMVSLFTGIKCKCDVSMTGEIDMTGNAKAIGGLDDKLYGVKREGIKLALYPEENQKDVDEILKNYPDLVDDTFKIKSYKNIYESLDNILETQLEWNEI
jgi:ATP-dependent Lon protease